MKNLKGEFHEIIEENLNMKMIAKDISEAKY